MGNAGSTTGGGLKSAGPLFKQSLQPGQAQLLDANGAPVVATGGALSSQTPPPPPPPSAPSAPPTPKPKPKEKVVTFVQPTDVLTSLRKTCETLNEYDKAGKAGKAGKAKKEKYQTYNSDEIVGFNLKMK